MTTRKPLQVNAGIGYITVIEEDRTDYREGIPIPPTNIAGQVIGRGNLVMYIDHQYNEVVMKTVRRIPIPQTAVAMDADSGAGPDAHFVAPVVSLVTDEEAQAFADMLLGAWNEAALLAEKMRDEDVP